MRAFLHLNVWWTGVMARNLGGVGQCMWWAKHTEAVQKLKGSKS